jgi:hypothetical protein
MIMNPLTMQKVPIEQFIVVTQHNGEPAIELRRTIKDKELIKNVIRSAFYNDPVLVLVPSFRNRLKAMASLIEKGIVYKNKEKDSFFFTF